MFDQLKQLKQIAGLLGNAQEMKQRFEAMQQRLAALTVEAQAGGGAVRVVVDGTFKVRSIHLAPALLTSGEDESARLTTEALIREAVNAGMQKAQALAKDQIAGAAGDMDLDLSSFSGLLGGGR
jgi:hypothetical protein